MINQFLWEDILKEAERRGIPLTKKRAVLREFLQVKFLTTLYHFPLCQNLSFISGTSLRLLQGLDRFSEDLDFDNFGLNISEIKHLFEKAVNEFKKEKFNFEFDFKKTKDGGRGKLSFSDLLFQLGISSNPREKLMIRLDFTHQRRIETEVLLLAEFGMNERVVTNTLPVLLSQKTKALILRKQTRGRDFYDIYWLLSRKIKPNLEVLRTLNIKSETEFFFKLKEIYQKEKKNIPFYKSQIRPFLLHEENERYLDFLEDFLI
jgi:predicted nucleotidyltransferase component of viral defense system